MKIKTISIVETISSKNPYLTPNTEYWVIGFDDENYRVLDDNKEPILYPKYLFEIIDKKYSDDWVKVSYDDGEYFVDPPELSDIYFYEKYFDGDKETREVFRQYCLKKGLLLE
jgi:hypothetical protein